MSRGNVTGMQQPKKLTLEYFSLARTNMMAEVNRHEPLCRQLVELGTDAQWGQQLGEIAAYVNVMMDGDYSQADLETLYPQLQTKLRQARSPIILSDKIGPLG